MPSTPRTQDLRLQLCRPQKVELVNFCVSAIGLIDRREFPRSRTAGTPPKPDSRPVYFDGSFRDTPVFARAELTGAGFQFEGPAIVEEFGSTTVVFPGQHLTVDPHGILIIKAGGKLLIFALILLVLVRVFFR
jgi:N-methylhydantoinase A